MNFTKNEPLISKEDDELWINQKQDAKKKGGKALDQDYEAIQKTKVLYNTVQEKLIR